MDGMTSYAQPRPMNPYGGQQQNVPVEEAVANYEAQVAYDGDTRNDWLTQMPPDVAAEMLNRYEGGDAQQSTGLEGYGAGQEPAPIAAAPDQVFGGAGDTRTDPATGIPRMFSRPRNQDVFGGHMAARERGQAMFAPEEQGVDPMMGLGGGQQDAAPTTAQANQEWAMANRPADAAPPEWAQQGAAANPTGPGGRPMSALQRKLFPRAAIMADTLAGTDLRQQARDVRNARLIGNYELERQGGGQTTRRPRPQPAGGITSGY